MNAIIKVNEDTQMMSARELHESLDIGTDFRHWIVRMIEYGFTEGEDFNVVKNDRVQIEGGREVKREVTDYDISMDMAKQICMIQRTPEGKQVRQYLIDLEKAWNTPEQVMARALRIANQTIDSLHEKVGALQQDNARMKPKEIFGSCKFALPYPLRLSNQFEVFLQYFLPFLEKSPRPP